MDTRERFTNRVENYVRYRPDYPQGVLAYLKERAGVAQESTVADVGAGTGIFTRQLSPYVRKVYAVEPNAPMRRAAEETFGAFSNITAVDGSAEHTALPDASADVVTAAECFHWFDPRAFRAECLRILKPGGRAVVLWNTRKQDDWVNEACRTLWTRYSPDYARVAKPTDDLRGALSAFFGGPYLTETFENPQRQDRKAFIGRILSASYSPLPGTPGHEPFLAELNAAFDAHAKDGMAEYSYLTTVYWAEPAR